MPTITKSTTDQLRSKLYQLASDLAQDAFTRYCRDIGTLLYVVGDEVRAVTTTFDNLRVADESDEAGELVIQEHIPHNLPLRSLTDWIHDRLRRTPLTMYLTA